jgi:hypothetical protein
MTHLMLGPLVLLAALASPTTPATGQVTGPIADAGRSSRATAYATASIRIVSGVRFGPDQLSGASGADRRKAVLPDADGMARPAELLEFQ